MKEGINEVEPLGTKPGNDVADASKMMTNQTPLRWLQRRPWPIPGGMSGAGIMRILLQYAGENGLISGACTRVRWTDRTEKCKSYSLRFEGGSRDSVAQVALCL